MTENAEPQFLYLTTIGRKTGNPHQIEIWFVEREGLYYMVSEDPDHSDWVRNIAHNPAITFRVGSRDAEEIVGTGRRIDPATEPELTAAVKALMDAKYEWSDGGIVELKPNERRVES